jgi:hypothetical protein
MGVKYKTSSEINLSGRFRVGLIGLRIGISGGHDDYSLMEYSAV